MSWLALCHGCAARFLSPGCNIPYANHTTLILIEIPTFADVTGPQEINAVPAHPNVFASILKLFPWGEFNQAVRQHGAKAARSFSYRSQLVAMIYAQLAGVGSSLALEAEMASHADRLQPLGITVPRARYTPRCQPLPVCPGLRRGAGDTDRPGPALASQADGGGHPPDRQHQYPAEQSRRWASFAA